MFLFENQQMEVVCHDFILMKEKAEGPTDGCKINQTLISKQELNILEACFFDRKAPYYIII